MQKKSKLRKVGDKMPHNKGRPNLPFFVNPFSRLFRPLHSVEKRTSEEQLRQDFGEFPPTPLRCENLAGQFDIVRTRGIGQIYHDLVMQSQVLEAKIETLSTDLVARFGADRLRDLHSAFERLGPRGTWFVKRAIFGWTFVVGTVKMILHGTKRRKVFGLFVPYFKDELQISVMSRGRLNSADAHIVSHEHIHLLQFKNPESHSRRVRSPQGLLTEEALADSFLLYILEKMEVEARLHESVLSFYRAHHYLPTTVSGFLGLLASSKTIGLQVTSILEAGDVTFQRDQGTYSDREGRPVEHLGWILMDIKTPELQRRFITEVMPVMYGNMLKYYGDDAASRQFLSSIDRPNFYDDLYGAQSTGA